MPQNRQLSGKGNPLREKNSEERDRFAIDRDCPFLAFVIKQRPFNILGNGPEFLGGVPSHEGLGATNGNPDGFLVKAGLIWVQIFPNRIGETIRRNLAEAISPACFPASVLEMDFGKKNQTELSHAGGKQ